VNTSDGAARLRKHFGGRGMKIMSKKKNFT
jgi:hypothetical protein